MTLLRNYGCLEWDDVFILIESQMVIVDLKLKKNWNQECCHSNIKKMHHVTCFLEYIIIAKIQMYLPYYLQRCSSFSVLTTYWNSLWRHQLSNLQNRKSWIPLEREKISEKGKYRRFSFWKAFYISASCFLLHMHFKRKAKSVKCSNKIQKRIDQNVKRLIKIFTRLALNVKRLNKIFKRMA